MHRKLVWMTLSCVLAIAGVYAWKHRLQLAERVAEPQGPVADANTDSSEPLEAHGIVTITGPLIDYMSRQRTEATQTQRARGSSSSSPTSSDKPRHKNLIDDSFEAESSTPILHKTFEVAALVNLPFDIPPHAANPQLHGSYRSFWPKDSVAPDETSADVEFLLLNQQQFSALLNGRSGDAMFSGGDSHDQEIRTDLPPSFAHPIRYYLVFRNNSRANRTMLVQADFRVDF